jgi:FMN phosphatase YigB (HAD superfamily)
MAGVDPSRALHVGDRRVEDYEGARAAGARALLLDRHGNEAGPDVITTLLDVAGRIRE